LLWRCRAALRRSDATYRTHADVLLRIDNDTLFQWWNVVNYGGYEVVLLMERLLAPGDVYVDVGANLGYMALNAARIVGDAGLVVAVEPEPRVGAKLEMNVQLNRAANVRIVREAVASAAGSATFRIATEEGLSRLENRRQSDHGMVPLETITVPVTTLPDVVQRHAPGRAVTLVKIDVEGHELAVLEASGPMLSAGITWFVAEINPGALTENGASLRRIGELLRAYGYAVYWISSHSADWFRLGRFPSLTRIDALTAADCRGADILAVPPGQEARLRTLGLARR
jgi:FkbM family methyltransferase